MSEEEKLEIEEYCLFNKSKAMMINMYIDELCKIKDLEKQNNDLKLIYRNTYKHFYKLGNDELAEYFMAQINDCPTFEITDGIDYYERCKTLEERIEKAVEYIKNTSEYEYEKRRYKHFKEEKNI